MARRRQALAFGLVRQVRQGTVGANIQETGTDGSDTLSQQKMPGNDSNLTGLSYRDEALRLPWRSPIWDTHVHLRDVRAAKPFFEVADLLGIERVWSMTNLEQTDDITAEYGDRVSFIAVPNYHEDPRPETFTTDWLHRIERFAAKGVRICKFWAAPRGVDAHPELRLGSPVQREAMALAASFCMKFMVHVADPDIWFYTHYEDHKRYGTKADQYLPWRRLLEEYPDTHWLASHMAGDPEHLDHVQELLDSYPHLYVDTAAAKWMVRELGRNPEEFGRFCLHNAGRILFGTDIVADVDSADFDLFASRYWSLRTLLETDYDGPSPIADPDAALQGQAQPPPPEVPPEVAPEVQSLESESNVAVRLRGARLNSDTLMTIYSKAAGQFIAD